MTADTIHKDDLLGKYVEYRDKDGKLRTNKVIRIRGNILTVKDAVDTRRCVNLDNVFYQIHHKHCKTKIISGKKLGDKEMNKKNKENENIETQATTTEEVKDFIKHKEKLQSEADLDRQSDPSNQKLETKTETTQTRIVVADVLNALKVIPDIKVKETKYPPCEHSVKINKKTYYINMKKYGVSWQVFENGHWTTTKLTVPKDIEIIVNRFK